MTKEQILPLVMIILSLGSSVVYFAGGDIRRGLYWFFAAGITTVVTF